jgi:hypothetical protein
MMTFRVHLIVLLAMLGLVPERNAAGSVILVGPSQTYTSIFDGYNAALAGDTILIDDGLYNFRTPDIPPLIPGILACHGHECFRKI